MGKISVVINTLNEEKNIERAIKSVGFADEIVVCDMYSDDRTVELAKKLGAKVVEYTRTDYVEPARNFAISKALGDWVLILDADEEIPKTLGEKLREMVDKPIVSEYVEIPRKNIIFGKWMKASMWWPDFHIRFFKKGKVIWNDKIHSKPQTHGDGLVLVAEEANAIVHHHYENIAQFIDRMNRYSTIQAKELKTGGCKFSWEDLFKKPLGEFLSRYFANRGFEDGMHGLALSFLQGFSFLLVYLKLWEMEGFKEENIGFSDVKQISKGLGEETGYWLKYGNLSKEPFKRFVQKVKNRLW